MHGRIAKLAKGFLTEDVEHSKLALASPRSNLRLRAIGFSKAIDVRYAEWIMALVIPSERSAQGPAQREEDRKSTRLNSSHPSISYAVFCLNKKNDFAACQCTRFACEMHCRIADR